MAGAQPAFPVEGQPCFPLSSPVPARKPTGAPRAFPEPSSDHWEAQ